ncbi:hypothetical protein C4568_04950 [Candidatus Parcubacteria bacterium]|nr:MAG: hypothetical protein C4568_04950 [Candidatus Parcubacteria bacterium]
MTLTLHLTKRQRIKLPQVPITTVVCLATIVIALLYVAAVAQVGPEPAVIDFVWRHTIHAEITAQSDIWTRLEVFCARILSGVIAGIIQLTVPLIAVAIATGVLYVRLAGKLR